MMSKTHSPSSARARGAAHPGASRPGMWVIRMGPVAVRWQRRSAALGSAAALVMVALGAWALTLGSFPLSLSEVYGALRDTETGAAGFIVRDLRLPRVLAAMAVGAMLAMSGAVFQGIVRNPLVAPDIIGINTGASAAAVLWIVLRRPLAYLPAAAFAGAIAAAIVVYALTWRGRIAGARLILVGIGVNSLLTAATTFLLTRAEIYDASRAMLWMTGSVYASDWGDVRLLGVALAVLVPVGLVLMWPLGVLQLGDLAAQSLGMAVERQRLALIVVGCALSSLAVSVAGPIGFVALMSPHIARMLAGPMTGGVFLLTGLIGGILVLGSDMIGQHAFGVSLPAGVVTAALGAPYFLWLLYRTQARV